MVALNTSMEAVKGNPRRIPTIIGFNLVVAWNHYKHLDHHCPVPIFSASLANHEEHLAIVFDILQKEKLYASAKKVDLYSLYMDCLGHIIDDRGIHPHSINREQGSRRQSEETAPDIEKRAHP